MDRAGAKRGASVSRTILTVRDSSSGGQWGGGGGGGEVTLLEGICFFFCHGGKDLGGVVLVKLSPWVCG